MLNKYLSSVSVTITPGDTVLASMDRESFKNQLMLAGALLKVLASMAQPANASFQLDRRLSHIISAYSGSSKELWPYLRPLGDMLIAGKKLADDGRLPLKSSEHELLVDAIELYMALMPDSSPQ